MIAMMVKRVKGLHEVKRDCDPAQYRHKRGTTIRGTHRGERLKGGQVRVRQVNSLGAVCQFRGVYIHFGCLYIFVIINKSKNSNWSVCRVT